MWAGKSNDSEREKGGTPTGDDRGKEPLGTREGRVGRADGYLITECILERYRKECDCSRERKGRGPTDAVQHGAGDREYQGEGKRVKG